MKLSHILHKISFPGLKKILICGAVFPILAGFVLLLSGTWARNFRTLRHMGCYLPLPIFIILYLSCFFFLSLAFFLSSMSDTCRSSENVYNAKILTLCAAFLLKIWFCLEFFAFSPLCSLICVLASFVFSFCAVCFSAKISFPTFLFSALSVIFPATAFCMNLKVLFI